MKRSINEEGLDVKMLTLCKEVKGFLLLFVWNHLMIRTRIVEM